MQKCSACTLDCLNHVEDVIKFEGPPTIAAVIIEPVIGTNGIIIPADGYLQGIRELCTRYGILFIADEIMSGFGRTGEWFAVNNWNVVPDMITVAKGVTSSYLPLGDVRQIGLFAALELVKDRDLREPLAPFNAKASEMGAMGKLGAFFRQNGLYTMIRWNIVMCNPPLCINQEQLCEGLKIIDRGLDITDAAVNSIA